MVVLYNFAIRLYVLAIRIAALFSPKAKLWINGRKELLSKVKQFRTTHQGKLIWFHCASLGEFEQGRPVIEGLKKAKPDCLIVVTFFSPSGYEIRKDYAMADGIFYLPADTPQKAKSFVNALNPNVVLFVKYEFWYNHLQVLHQKNIPTFLISAVFKSKHVFFKKHGGLHRKMLTFFDKIYVQDKDSATLLNSIDYNKISVAGDTRVDRVIDIVVKGKAIDPVEIFTKGHFALIAGSTWAKDEALLAEVLKEKDFKDWKIVIAPHEIDENHIQQIETQFSLSTVRYSQANEQTLRDAKVLIIDNIGMLSTIYRYGKLAYIGGGFGVGIHNTLEPAAHGLPVIFGAKYQKFTEANWLVENGGGFVVQNVHDLKSILQKMKIENDRTTAAQQAAYYIKSNKGASVEIINDISKLPALQ